MRCVKLTIEYDGTGYAGWQIQPNGVGVQQVLEEALERILKRQVRLYSSGRTDAGVHARGMVAAFRFEGDIPLTAFSEGLNALLPADVAVRDATEASPDFDPRGDAVSKTYRYSIFRGKRRSPLERLYAWHLRNRLDVKAMEKAAGFFIGEHDFSAFRTTGCAAKTTIRKIYSVEITEKGDILHLDVTGGGFLRNMVRIMVGTLVEIGMGKKEPEAILQMLEGRERAGVTAPARGLCLMKVVY